MCGAIKGGPSLEGIDVKNQAVIQGIVTKGDEPVGNAYVRLLDRNGEFTAEVPTSATGQFRFFAAAGSWTLRTLCLLYTSPSPRDRQKSRMPSSA